MHTSTWSFKYTYTGKEGLGGGGRREARGEEAQKNTGGAADIWGGGGGQRRFTMVSREYARTVLFFILFLYEF